MQKNVVNGSVHQSRSHHLNSGLGKESKPREENLSGGYSEKLTFDLDTQQGRHGLFSHHKVNSNEQKALFDHVIPKEFSLKEAKGEGDCFYDACAQALNEWSKRNEYTIKSLRLLCHEYAVNLDQRSETNPKHPDNWIAKAFNGDGAEYHRYLANVQYTAEECEAGEGLGNDKCAIWGEPHIDGRILCVAIGIKLHVIEVRENPDDETNKNQKFIISHNLIDSNGLKCVGEDYHDWNDKETLHIGVCNLHFVPILRNKYHKTSASLPLEVHQNGHHQSQPIVREEIGEAKTMLNDGLESEKDSSIDQPNGLNKATEKRVYRHLQQEGAKEYLIDQLKELYLKRNEEHINKFQDFLSVVPELYENLPYNYESVLAEIFWGRLQYHKVARVGLVQVFLNSLDPAIMSDYCRNIIEDELKTLKEKSPFRIKIEDFYSQWFKKLKEKKEKSAGYYIESEMHERIDQMQQLYKVLSHFQSTPNTFPMNYSERIYPDDKLIECVIEILKGGKKYYQSFIDTNILCLEDFGFFLDELAIINNARLSKKLLAHDKTLACQDFDVLLAVKTLHYENLRRPYFHRLFTLLQAMMIQNSKLIERHDHVVELQKEFVHDYNYRAANLEAKYFKEVSKLNKVILDLQSKLIILRRQKECEGIIMGCKPSPRTVSDTLNIKHGSRRVELDNSSKNNPNNKIKAPPKPRRLQLRALDSVPNQADELKRLVDENTELKIENCSLLVKLAEAEHECAKLHNIEFDNIKLRRQLTQMKLQLEAEKLQNNASTSEHSTKRLYNPKVSWHFPNSDPVDETDDAIITCSDNEQGPDVRDGCL